MGALHEGHLSLVRRARQECDRVVVSIFINPLQFGPREDLARYPRDLKKDKISLRKEGVDLLFLPSRKTMYPDQFQTSITVRTLSKPLCGVFRPGHFEGVATVCAKLFHLVSPDVVYVGQKDFQQTRVIAQMIKDLYLNIQLRVLPTVREKDGLALSSRNQYLSIEEREKAIRLYRTLSLGKNMIREGERRSSKIRAKMRSHLREKGLQVEYLSVVHPETLQSVSRIRLPVVLAVAARIGKTRLIDNLLVKK